MTGPSPPLEKDEFPEEISKNQKQLSFNRKRIKYSLVGLHNGLYIYKQNIV